MPDVYEVGDHPRRTSEERHADLARTYPEGTAMVLGRSHSIVDIAVYCGDNLARPSSPGFHLDR
jgi:hypothetical protein